MIAKSHDADIEVYAWRWPTTSRHPTSLPRYYALDEADYVADMLVPRGLDGYVVDPESDGAGAVDNRDSAQFTHLATQFCQRSAASPSFSFGTTSGCKYPIVKPHIPRAAFAVESDGGRRTTFQGQHIRPRHAWRHLHVRRLSAKAEAAAARPGGRTFRHGRQGHPQPNPFGARTYALPYEQWMRRGAQSGRAAAIRAAEIERIIRSRKRFDWRRSHRQVDAIIDLFAQLPTAAIESEHAAVLTDSVISVKEEP